MVVTKNLILSFAVFVLGGISLVSEGATLVLPDSLVTENTSGSLNAIRNSPLEDTRSALRPNNPFQDTQASIGWSVPTRDLQGNNVFSVRLSGGSGLFSSVTVVATCIERGSVSWMMMLSSNTLVGPDQASFKWVISGDSIVGCDSVYLDISTAGAGQPPSVLRGLEISGAGWFIPAAARAE